jgi:hypothetical protein
MRSELVVLSSQSSVLVTRRSLLWEASRRFYLYSKPLLFRVQLMMVGCESRLQTRAPVCRVLLLTTTRPEHSIELWALVDQCVKDDGV